VLEQLGAVQLALREEDLVGWLLMSAGGQNPIAERLLRVDGATCRRRWFYWIPANGIPVLVAHRAEFARFPSLPGESILFASWPELRDALSRVLPARGRVAMEYSPMGIDPQLSRVDAGTMQLVQSYGPYIVCSAVIVRRFTTRWSETHLKSFEDSTGALSGLLDQSFEWLGHLVAKGEPPTEQVAVERIIELANDVGMRLCHPPRVATGPNSADPTYIATRESDRQVAEGDVVQITVGGAGPTGSSTAASAVAYAGAPPAEVLETHALIVRAMHAALDLVRERYAAGRRVLGFEVDRAVRDVFAGAGLADMALHRSGHGISPRGGIAPGTQLDSLEMHDVRPVEPGYVFVLHPGLYRQSFGIRLATCFHVDQDGTLRVAPALDKAPRVLTWATDN